MTGLRPEPAGRLDAITTMTMTRQIAGVPVVLLAAGAAVSLLAAGAAVALMFASATSALAQTSPPVELVPAPSPATPGPSGPATPTPSEPAPPAAVQTPKEVEISPLEDLPIDGIGTLEADGLGRDLWRGSSRTVIESLIASLPATQPSPAARSLLRRVLLTSAAPPQGRVGTDFVSLRAERLVAIGAVADGAKLLRLASPARMDEGSAQLAVDGSLLAGDPDQACALVASLAGAMETNLYGQQVGVFCHLRKGERDTAFLGVDLLREQGLDDPAFFTLVNALDGDAKAKVRKLERPTALHLAMLHAAERPTPDGLLPSLAPAEMATALALPKGEPKAKLAAAERAASLGAIAPGALGEVYAAFIFGAKERSGAGTKSGAEPRGRALLYQTARSEALPDRRALFARRGLEAARHSGMPGLYEASAALYAPLLAGVPVTSAVAPHAPETARAFFLAGRAEAAKPWIAAARSLPTDTGVQAALPGLALLAEIAGVGEAAWSSSIAAWIKGRLRWDPGPAATRLAAIAVSFPTTPGPALAAPPFPASTDPAALIALGDAAAAGRVGETALFAIAALDGQGAGAADPATLRAVLAALRSVGLDADARALALEAAVANGA